MSKTVLFLLPGILFAAGLAIAGMTNPGKVTGFLDITGDWDPSLAFVMVGAIAVFGIGSRIVERRPEPLLHGRFPAKPSNAIDRRVLIGSALFGIGWGIGGICPGPAVTNLATLRPEIFAFVAAMIAGVLVAQRGFGADR